MSNNLRTFASKLKTLVNKGVVRAVDDSGRQQRIQMSLFKDEVKNAVQRIQQYGFTSHPLPGAQVVLLCVGGDRDHPIAIVVDDSNKRPKDLQPGEVAIYHQNGDKIILKNDNAIEVTTNELIVKAAAKVRLETPVLECTGEIKDHCDSTGKTMSNMREIYNDHTHPETSTTTQKPNQQM